MRCKRFFTPSAIEIGALAFWALIACALGVSCDAVDSYYLSGAGDDRANVQELFGLLGDDRIVGAERFTVVREIGEGFLKRKEYGKLVNFLTEYVDSNPDDPYDTFHLFTIAYAYESVGSAPIAAFYFDLIVKNYPDLVLKGESIHRTCLTKLVESTASPERRIDYRRELVARFSDKIDMGQTLFLLGKDYEAIGEWDDAVQAYQKYLPYFSSSIPGYPDAVSYARNVIDFANSPKDWTFESLDKLVAAVKVALDSGSPSQVSRLRTKVNFFAMSWHQDQHEGSSATRFDFAPFMGGGRISYSSTLESYSNSREGYLRTWGWTDRSLGWTFYFRKINFPADPEIHGRWEWAGIYYGERLE